jgi:hypothetical protein
MTFREINTKLITKLDKMNKKELYKYLEINTNVRFSANPIKEMALYVKRGVDSDFSQHYNRDISFELFKYLIYKAKFFENLNICVFSAQQRSSKSTTAISLSLFFRKLINYNFAVDKDIFGSQITFLAKLGEREFNSIACIDEYIETHAQIGSYLGEEALKDISKITAKELLHSVQIYRYLPQHTNALIALEPIGKDFVTSQTKCLVYDIESYETDFNKTLLGYAIIPAYDRTIGKINHFELLKLKKLTEFQAFRLAYEHKKDLWNKDIILRKIINEVVKK